MLINPKTGLTALDTVCFAHDGTRFPDVFHYCHSNG